MVSLFAPHSQIRKTIMFVLRIVHQPNEKSDCKRPRYRLSYENNKYYLCDSF